MIFNISDSFWTNFAWILGIPFPNLGSGRGGDASHATILGCVRYCIRLLALLYYVACASILRAPH